MLIRPKLCDNATALATEDCPWALKASVGENLGDYGLLKLTKFKKQNLQCSPSQTQKTSSGLKDAQHH